MSVMRYILLAGLLGLCLGAMKRYDGYKVLRVTPSDDFQLRSIASLKRDLESRVDFWVEPSHVGRFVDLMVAPDDADFVQELLAEHGLEILVTIEDVQQLIEENNPKQPESHLTGLGNFNYNAFHTFDEIMTWVNDVANERSDIAKKVVITSSGTFEGRQLVYLKLGKPGSNKPIFWLMSGLHAREWLSPATQLKMVDMFLTKYGSDSEVTDLLNKVDFYWMPIANPDGYVYSHNGDRLWRKTRSTGHSTWCVGVDPNRNWDSHWDDSSQNTNPCSETFRGPSAFSEDCVRNIGNHVKSLSNVKVFIDMHCYSQLWMTPYGYTYNLPSNYYEQKNLADSAMAALKAVHGKSFQTGSISGVLYEAAGSSADWAYDNAGIQICYAPELRPTRWDSNGFVVPTSTIQPSAEEVFEAIKVIAKHIA